MRCISITLVALGVQALLLQQLDHELDGPQPGQQAGVEGDFVHAIHDLAGRVGRDIGLLGLICTSRDIPAPVS